MTLPILIPSSTSNAASPGSDDSTLPRTPESPSQALPLEGSTDNSSNNNTSSNSTNNDSKRKPSRRANTAERRATHNAVERQRRETLNGRFLDLAALLPNLSQIRRPSKSSIVNSSIAHIHASRRHRVLAARELRLLKMESDALRRELNEWRDRAGIPRVEEPIRSEGFSVVLSAELELMPVHAGMEGVEEGDEDLYPAGYDDGAEEPQQPQEYAEDPRVAMMKAQQAQQQQAQQQQQVYAHQHPHPHPYPHMVARPNISIPSSVTPMIASPTGMSFDNPTLYVEQQQVASPYAATHYNYGGEEKGANPWAAFAQQQQQQRPGSQGGVPVPPAMRGRSGSMSSSGRSSSGSASPPSHEFAVPASPAEWQMMQQMGMQNGMGVGMGQGVGGGMGGGNVVFGMMM